MAKGFGYSTPSTVMDLGAVLAVNFGASYMAAESPNLRWQPWGQSDNGFMDVRVIGGLAGVATAMWGPKEMRRVGQDAALGLLSSFVATERVLAKSRALHQEGAAQQQQAPGGFQQPAITATPEAPALPPPAAPGILEQAAEAARRVTTEGGPGSFY